MTTRFVLVKIVLSEGVRVLENNRSNADSLMHYPESCKRELNCKKCFVGDELQWTCVQEDEDCPDPGECCKQGADGRVCCGGFISNQCAEGRASCHTDPSDNSCVCLNCYCIGGSTRLVEVRLWVFCGLFAFGIHIMRINPVVVPS